MSPALLAAAAGAAPAEGRFSLAPSWVTFLIAAVQLLALAVTVVLVLRSRAKRSGKSGNAPDTDGLLVDRGSPADDAPSASSPAAPAARDRLAAAAAWARHLGRSFSAALATVAERLPAPRHPLALALFAAALAALAFASFVQSPPEAEANLDIARDLLHARDLLQTGELIPVQSSLRGVTQGGLWTRVLAATRASGHGIAELAWLVLFLQGLAVGVVYLAGRTLAVPFGGAVAAGLYFYAMHSTFPNATLWIPVLLPLPTALALWGLAGLVRGGALGWAALAGVGTGLAIDVHIVSLVLLAPLVAAAVGFARRPLLAAPLALLCAAGAHALPSWRTVLHNAQLLASPAALAGSAGALLLFVGLGVVCRRYLRERPWRGAAFFGGTAAALGVALYVGSLVLGFRLEERYLLPFVALGVMGIAAATLSLLQRFATPTGPFLAGVVALCAFAPALTALWPSSAPPRRVRALTESPVVSEIEKVAPILYGEWGWRWPDVRASVVAPSARNLVGILAAMEEPPRRAPTPVGPLRLLFAPRAGADALIGPLTMTVDAGPDRIALLERMPVYVRRNRVMRQCIHPPAGAAPRCRTVSFDPVAVGRKPATESFLANRGYPEPYTEAAVDPERFFAPCSGCRLTFEYTLDVPGGGPDHDLVVADAPQAEEDMAWQVEAVHGVATTTSLPARIVRLSGHDARQGRLVLGRRAPEGSLRFSGDWPPDVIELRADEVELRRLFEQSLQGQSVAGPDARRTGG